MIAGLEEPTAGDVLIGGRVVNALTPRERGIAMVFQSYALYPHLTVYDNIAFPLKAQGVPQARARRQVGWAAEKFGIAAPPGAQAPGALRRRAAARGPRARARARAAGVPFDEPLSNLDAKLRASAREELQKFQKEIGTTAVYVTHDQVEAMALGDRVVIMDHGRVRQIGTPAEVYDDPADTFVATFLGSPPMNLLERDGIDPRVSPRARAGRGRPGAGRRRALPVPLRADGVPRLGAARLRDARGRVGRPRGRLAVSVLGTGPAVGTVHDVVVEKVAAAATSTPRRAAARRSPVP